MTEVLSFEPTEERPTIQVGEFELQHDSPVHIQVGSEWFDGVLDLECPSPIVWVEELGHVELSGPCSVSAIAPLEKAKDRE